MVNHGKRGLALIFAALLVTSPALAQSISTQANTVFRDYNTPGNALSGIYNPPKADVRSLFGLVDTQIPHTADPHTWAATQTFSVAPVFTDASGSRSALGLGALAILNTPPAPTTSARGGVLSLACSTGQFINSVDTSGTPTCATPTTGTSTTAAGSSGQFQTNSSGSLAGVTISGAVSINGATGVSTLASPLSVAAITSPAFVQSAAFPKWFLNATGNPADKKNVQGFTDTSGNFYLTFVNDALTLTDPIFTASTPATFGDPVTVQFNGPVASLSSQVVPSGVSPQVAAGRQIGQVTDNYAGLNSQNDTFRVQVGSAPASIEFGSGNITAGNVSTAALTGALAIPAGSFSGAATWPDYAAQGVVVNYNTSKSGVGMFANANAGAAGASIQGINSVATNCVFASAPCNAGTGGGFNYGFMDGSELDVNVMPLTGGAAPSGNSTGLSIFHGGTIQPTGIFSAIRIAVGNPGTTPPWKVGIETGPGTAQVGISLGAGAASGASNSQPIFLNSNDGTTAHNASIQANSDGSLQLAPGGGTIVLGSVPTSGTATGTLCVASGNRIFVKTTAGACL